jgi:hypothetical protein
VVEINPIDASGNPTKKRGLILRNSTELNEFRRLINEAKLEVLMSAVERVNPKAEKPAQPKPGEEVVEI